VPDHLILHLKRFEFDLQTMARSKINDYFEFPNTLDMRPYTMEYLAAKEGGEETPSEPDEFELVGVLVHTGTAESGHYYSYIRDRVSIAETPSWLEFNDSDVSYFNPNSIPAACFGGSDNSNAAYVNKPFSAYMLFYQRKFSLTKIDGYSVGILQKNARLLNLEQLRLQIVKDNQQSLKQYCMFGPNYICFLRRLLTGAGIEEKLGQEISTRDTNTDEILRLSLYALDQIYSRFKDSTELEFLGNVIGQLIIQNPLSCKQFLVWAAQGPVLENLLMVNPFMAVRQTFAKLVCAGLRHLRVVSISAYGACSEDEDERRQSPVLLIAEGCVESWSVLQSSAKSWNDFFTMLVEIAQMGTEEVELLLRGGVLYKLLEMAVGPSYSHDQARELAGFAKLFGKLKLPAVKAAELLAILINRCTLFRRAATDLETRDSYRADEFMPLTYDEQRYMECYDGDRTGLIFLSKYLEINHTAPYVSSIVKSLLNRGDGSPKENQYVERIRNTLISGVSVDPAALAEPYLQCLQAFLQVTRSVKHMQYTIRKVSQEVQTIGNSGGMEHLGFFQAICTQQSFVDPLPTVIGNIWHWAPPLLVYYEEDVRDHTESFLERLLTHTTEEAGSARFRTPFVNLANGCFQFITETMRPNRRHLDYGMFSNVLRVLERCKEFQDDEMAFSAKLEGIRSYLFAEYGSDIDTPDLSTFTHNLVVEDDDVDVASGGSRQFTLRICGANPSSR
jgi:ubiquitin carboxyl-terminal hydrolase 34